MKVLRFPVPFNVGSDIVHLPRISRVLAGKYANRFVQRILRDEETADFRKRFHLTKSISGGSNPANGQQQDKRIIGDNFKTPGDLELTMTRWLAGRFAAKEAARKAAPLGAGSLSWKDILVRVEEQPSLDAGAASKVRGSRRPEVLYLRGYSDQAVKNAGEDAIARAGKLTISHDGEYVVATVLAPVEDDG
ncbi:4'-phosphopantetheinyl transferase [Ascosphaera apis ARSEF 7405]|uniref:4'-phosphopantetheinyl transferase n=1 Tax=Ascosphaera apis ARSEF 7405 TaxID=392613 RepID=A0A166PEG0_9EURO|nr:4'-phosphopantetheinyl transferase [Ascosphaera apis ARSEF 7405]